MSNQQIKYLKQIQNISFPQIKNIFLRGIEIEIILTFLRIHFKCMMQKKIKQCKVRIYQATKLILKLSKVNYRSIDIQNIEKMQVTNFMDCRQQLHKCQKQKKAIQQTVKEIELK
ncbi:hypothetical protein ABPG72_017363 [Tetrahymena utriculariae]